MNQDGLITNYGADQEDRGIPALPVFMSLWGTI